MDIYDPAYVKTLFNQMSKSYERMNFITSFGFSIAWRKQFIRKLPSSHEPIKVLDLLSGLGENWTYLIERYPEAQFLALDFSEEMVAQSRHKSLHHLGNRFKVLQQDVLNNKLPSDEFDVVTCAYGLKTFNEEQLNTLAQHLHRILKDGGQFSFIEISKPNNKLLLFFYGLYVGKIIPVLGKLFLGNPSDYRMLWTYTQRFASCERVKAIFEKHHLQVQYDSYFFGCATGISGIKAAVPTQQNVER
jgi:ubiquinone/menaquinone biosynthesis methyltransferase